MAPVSISSHFHLFVKFLSFFRCVVCLSLPFSLPFLVAGIIQGCCCKCVFVCKHSNFALLHWYYDCCQFLFSLKIVELLFCCCCLPYNVIVLCCKFARLFSFHYFFVFSFFISFLFSVLFINYCLFVLLVVWHVCGRHFFCCQLQYLLIFSYFVRFWFQSRVIVSWYFNVIVAYFLCVLLIIILEGNLF